MSTASAAPGAPATKARPCRWSAWTSTSCCATSRSCLAVNCGARRLPVSRWIPPSRRNRCRSRAASSAMPSRARTRRVTRIARNGRRDDAASAAARITPAAIANAAPRAPADDLLRPLLGERTEFPSLPREKNFRACVNARTCKGHHRLQYSLQQATSWRVSHGQRRQVRKRFEAEARIIRRAGCDLAPYQGPQQRQGAAQELRATAQGKGGREPPPGNRPADLQ